MEIRDVDPHAPSEDVLERAHRVLAACHAEANPTEPYRPPSDTVAYLRFPPRSEPRRAWVAVDDEVIGFAMLGIAAGTAQVLVDPGARRRGVGTALLAELVAAARAGGCTRVASAHSTPAGAAFAARCGAVDGERDVRSLLRLGAALPTPQAVDGYRLVSWNDAAPEALLESYARARTAIEDAPNPGAATIGWTAARVRELEDAVARRGRETRVTAALHRDEVVAFTELRVSADEGAVAATEDTAVVREHRGRRLATWMKAESLRRLHEDRPDVRLVSTTNAETNEPMLAVNRALGFRAVSVSTTCMLELQSST